MLPRGQRSSDPPGVAPKRRVAGAAHTLAGVLATAVLLGGAFLAWTSVRRIAENDRAVVHSHDVLDALGDVGATLTLAEDGARAFLITGDPNDLEPYRTAVAAIRRDLDRLGTLVAEEPRAARLPELRRLVDGRLRELERTIALRAEGFPSARAEVMTDLGRATMNAIRDELAERARRERRLLAERQSESERSYRVAVTNGVVVVAVGLVGIAALSVFIRRDLRARARIAERLAEIDRRKDDFLATLAHELRNPLAPLRTAVETLHISGERRKPVLQALDILTRQVRTMTRLVDDLLDLGRIARGVVDLERETVDLVLLVRQCVESAAPLVKEARHDLSLAVPGEPVFVTGDPARLTQIFANLLANAIKYTPEGGHIEVAVQATRSRGVVRVRDDGIGISREMLPRVFDMYAQAERTGRSQGGLGIGLAVARRLLEMQDATIEARSAGRGRGSEFTVHLPRTAAPAAALAVPTARPEPTRLPRRILVVDDVPDAANSLAAFLGMLGHEVRTARDGPSALELLEEFAPEIVLLDIGLPGMSGYEVAHRIRENPAHDGVVLVAQTGWGREEDRRRSAEAGFDHHLTKPFDPRALETLIGSLPS